MVLYLHAHLHARRGRQIPIQPALGCHVGTELRTYARATNALNRRAVSPAPRSGFKMRFFFCIYYYIISYCKSLWARGFFPIKFIENFIHVSSIFLFPPPLSYLPLTLVNSWLPHTNVADSYCKEPDIDCRWM